jgi:phage tail protein X
MVVASVLLNLNAQDLFGQFNSSDHVNALESRPADSKAEPTIQKESAPAVAIAVQPKDMAVPSDPLLSVEHLGMKSITVRPGDTLKELAATVYGRADDQTTSIVLQNNPTIKDGNQIEVGQRILFPFSSDGNPAPMFTVHIASLSPFRAAYKFYQKMVSDGHDVFILPVSSAKERKTFRITLGSFTRLKEAQAYADMLHRRGISDYAEPIRLESVQTIRRQLNGSS